MAVWHLRLYFVLGHNKEEMSFADRMNPCERLYAHYGGVNVVKHFALWSLISSALNSDANKSVCFSVLVHQWPN